MSATIIETPVEDKADTTKVPALAEVLAPVQEQEAAQPEPVVDDVPAKYQGKSIQDIIQMHQNAESLAGRQSSEVGDLRKIVDDFIVTQSNSTKQETKPDDYDDLHFLDNPNEAMNRAIDKHPSIVRANEIAASTAQAQANQEAQDRLLAQHPDTSEVISDSKFAEWIQSSKSRTRSLQTANSSNNVEAMSELLSEYKSSKPVTDTSGVLSKKDSARHASTGAISGNAEGSKKVFRRADLIKLKMSDPDRYSQLQPEIMAAYAEKRVI